MCPVDWRSCAAGSRPNLRRAKTNGLEFGILHRSDQSWARKAVDSRGLIFAGMLHLK